MTCDLFKEIVASSPFDRLPSERIAARKHFSSCESCKHEMIDRATAAMGRMTTMQKREILATASTQSYILATEDAASMATDGEV